MRTLTVPAFIAEQMSVAGMIAAACALEVTILLPTPSNVGHADTIRPDRTTLGDRRPSHILRADMEVAARFAETAGAQQFIDAVLNRNVQTDQGQWVDGQRDRGHWAFIGRTDDRIEPKVTGWLIPPEAGEDAEMSARRIKDRVDERVSAAVRRHGNATEARLNSDQPGGAIDTELERKAMAQQATREGRFTGGHQGPKGDLPPPPSGRPIPSPESIVTSTMRAPDVTPGLKAQTDKGLMQLLTEELEQALIEHVYAEEAVPANNEALKLVVEARRRLGMAPTTIEIRPVFMVTIWFTDPGDTTYRRREWTVEVDDVDVLQDAQRTGLADFARAHPGMMLTGLQVVMAEMGTN